MTKKNNKKICRAYFEVGVPQKNNTPLEIGFQLNLPFNTFGEGPENILAKFQPWNYCGSGEHAVNDRASYVFRLKPR